MKASHLKEYIREEIIEILSEEGTVSTDNPEKAAKLAKQGLDVTVTEDEDEPSDADLRKTDSVAKVASELAKVTKEMKKHLEMYKDAEGKRAKDAALNMLKKLTAEKKKLEKQL